MSTSSPPATSNRPNEYFELSEEARADDQYVVEKILAKRRSRKGKWEYLLKWAGFSDEDNTWELETDIHPDLIADFERQQLDVDKATSVYSTIDDDPPLKTRKHSSSMRNETSPAKKKKKTSLGTTEKLTRSPPSSSVPVEPRKKIFGVEKGWRVRAVIGAAKQKDSSVIYAVDYVQGSPLLREYVPSEIAHIYIPRELIEFFQRKIVWNAPNEKETKN